MRYLVILLLLAFGAASCGTASRAKATLTTEEKARKALDDGDYETAIELYQELVDGAPEEYERYRFLAAAYAAAAGFDIIEVVKSNIGGNTSDSLLDVLGSFVPADPTVEQLTHLGLAKDTILAMPPDLRSRTNTEVDYASGAANQLEFYQSAYSIMYINRFAKIGVDGKLDPDRLNEMTDDDVTNILNNFSQVAATGGEGVPAAAQKIVDQIIQQEGETNKEKLINFLNANKKSSLKS